MARKTYKTRAKRPFPESLGDAKIMKMARQIVDKCGADGTEGVDRDDLAQHIWDLAMTLSPRDRWLLVAHSIKELSFREIGKQEHLKKKDAERIFDEVCAKLKRMFERFGTQEL
ncbi:MAG: hypothetical protein HYW56_01050 [Candidatus Harrisonbacteria bacterium]|nr:hypothetical protein [Candidatus Harrisonbacteria bacterium]MBI2604111.1 hypothetical protein [Candidatus Harrisonbacteria bacterium]